MKRAGEIVQKKYTHEISILMDAMHKPTISFDKAPGFTGPVDVVTH